MRFGHLLGFAILVASAAAFAESTPAAPPAAAETYHWQLGPKPIDLGHEVELQLPQGYVYLGMPDADRLLKKNGSFNNQNVVGLVVAADEKQQWAVIIDYEETGHVDDKEKIDAPELMKSIREGTDEGNKQRVENGFSELHIGDWTEEPHYDRATHRLVWALPVTDKDGTSINFNTRVLGRRGVVSLNLVSGPETIAAEKVNAATLLAATSFKKGARYEEFDKKTDKVAEYGLMGLILGGAGLGAAKLVKVGILAKLLAPLGKFLAVAWKAVIAFFVAIGAGIKRIFGGKTSAGTPNAQKETKLPPTGTDGQA
jgi:uncharacterized membrane-anchored protein